MPKIHFRIDIDNLYGRLYTNDTIKYNPMSVMINGGNGQSPILIIR